MAVAIADIEVVATNFNWRQSGGTTVVVQLVPEQAKTLKIAALGFDLPPAVPRIRWRSVVGLLRKPLGRPVRIWHCRRNNEMIVGLFLRDVLKAPLRVIFNSAGQRRHQPFTRWMRPSRTMQMVQTTAVEIVMRLRLRSATPELPAPLDMPPPNMSDRPPPRPLCMRTSGMASRLVRTSTTMQAIRRKSTDVPFWFDR